MKRRLLVLDDDPTIGATVAMIAESAGFESVATTAPEEFFRLLDDAWPSHIALDLVMPEMDGVQVMTHLAARQCKAGIVITSGVGSRVLDAAKRSAAEHGLNIVGTLSKPFTPAALRALLLAAEPGAWDETDTDLHQLAPRVQTDPEISRADLVRAIAENELFLVYQPQVSCRNGEVSGFEALVRWRHPSLGIVMPDRFIPIAEGTGLIDAVTDRVVELGFAWLARSFPCQPEDAPADEVDQDQLATLSINLSARSLGDRDFVEDLLEACLRHKLSPERIILELTESSAMRDPVATLDQLTRMRMKGFQLSIDDFGTGFSSMLQLARLPFSEIKVDKSFVMAAMQSVESRAVIRSIIELGNSFGLRTVAEGVEDAGTLEYLAGLGCDIAQGYFISRPMPDQDLANWLAARSAETPAVAPGTARIQARASVEAFRWDESLITGLETVDGQHKRLVQLINRFGAALVSESGVSRRDIDIVFSELVDYANYHFREEETMMAAVGLHDGYIEFHRSEHANFIAQLLHLRDTGDSEQPESLQPALRFLIHWLAYHILGVDQGMARQVQAVREGMNPQDAAQQQPAREAGQEPLVKALTALFELLSQSNRALREANRELEEKVFEHMEASNQANRQLAVIARTDPLTGIPNRRHALAVLNLEWESALAESDPLACLLIDADHLKPVNDIHGHEAGDMVLRSLADCLQDAVRMDDVVCRWGGDEFLVILPSTDLAGAQEMAENIRRAVGRLRVVAGKVEWPGSVSIGIAAYDAGMSGPEDLIKALDETVCAAKHAGGNAVLTAPAAPG
ncbi:MAG: bacteriohemerythrin [Gammaproteobacteria bacterium]